MTTSIIVTFDIEGMHNFPNASQIFPEVYFLENKHRHTFNFKLEKQVYHDNRDVEFIMFKRDVIEFINEKYYSNIQRTHDFENMSCEMIAKELLISFDLLSVEVWEDNENGARVQK